MIHHICIITFQILVKSIDFDLTKAVFIRHTNQKEKKSSGKGLYIDFRIQNLEKNNCENQIKDIMVLIY